MKFINASVTSINNYLVFVAVDKDGDVWFCETSRPELEWIRLPAHPDSDDGGPTSSPP